MGENMTGTGDPNFSQRRLTDGNLALAAAVGAPPGNPPVHNHDEFEPSRSRPINLPRLTAGAGTLPMIGNRIPGSFRLPLPVGATSRPLITAPPAPIALPAPPANPPAPTTTPLPLPPSTPFALPPSTTPPAAAAPPPPPPPGDGGAATLRQNILNLPQNVVPKLPASTTPSTAAADDQLAKAAAQDLATATDAMEAARTEVPDEAGAAALMANIQNLKTNATLKLPPSTTAPPPPPGGAEDEEFGMTTQERSDFEAKQGARRVQFRKLQELENDRGADDETRELAAGTLLL